MYSSDHFSITGGQSKMPEIDWYVVITFVLLISYVVIKVSV